MTIATTSTTTTPPPTTTRNATAAATGEGTSTSGLAADFETFLTLLTTQMRNQDPLQPMESTEFISQLATFSGVEQQVRANQRLDGILSALSGDTSAGLAEWIGREVRAPTKAAYEGDPIEVGFTAADDADRNLLVVKNAFGSVVASRTLDSGATEATWDGTDDLGNGVAHGDYTFAVESYDGDTLLGTQTGTIYATVTEVRIADGKPALVLGNGEQVPLDSITGLR